MNNIDPSINRSAFFPKSREAKPRNNEAIDKVLRRNSYEKQSEIENQTKKDARVDINSKVKDFSRIKSAVDRAPDIDNSEKIAKLKAQIASGKYNMNYDAIADRMLQSEF